MLKHLFFALIVGMLFMQPIAAYAQGELIVCGSADPQLLGQKDGAKYICTFKDFMLLAAAVNNFLLFKVMIPLATAAFAASGVYYVWGSWDPGKINTAKSIFLWTFQGAALAVGGWIIINTILGFLVKGEFIGLAPVR